jgi:hypothetical protein
MRSPLNNRAGMKRARLGARLAAIAIAGGAAVVALSQSAGSAAGWPKKIQTVLDNTKPLAFPRAKRLPLYLWPAMDPGKLDAGRAETLVRELDRRGIGLVSTWDHGHKEGSLASALAVARAQKKLGLAVAINATPLLYAVFDGEPGTAHVDAEGHPFFDDSFGQDHQIGCPFALDFRLPVIRERVEFFLRAYRKEGLPVDFIWADWEIDGPLEFNRAHAAALKCRRCRESIPGLENFLEFQRVVRGIRSRVQREVFASPVKEAFPGALVGNYAVYPHNGFREWYDYFEEYEEGQPHIADQKARYRHWANEFETTGYTFAMPVVYPWARLFGWYDFADADFRWFYNMLLVASNAGESAPPSLPLIPFVHWHPIDAEKFPNPEFKAFSSANYQELLWHMLLRGADTFYLWCGEPEYPDEVRLLHEVYAAAQEYGEFLEQGVPVTYSVPKKPAPVVSALRLGDRLLVRRTDFGAAQGAVTIEVAGRKIVIPESPGRCQVLKPDSQAVKE